MGQRGAVVLFLVGGGLLIPAALVLLIGHSLGAAAMPIALGSLFFGFVCLVASKWPALRRGHLWSFGPGGRTGGARRAYWIAYVLLATGLLLALAAAFTAGPLR
jgi:hypothetical protein